MLQEFAPHPALKPYIRCYWHFYLSNPDDVKRGMRALTDGMETTFCLSDPVVDTSSGAKPSIATNGKLFGPMSKPIQVYPSGRVELFGVNFRPGGGYPFFHYSATNLKDQMIIIDELWGAEGVELVERMTDPMASHAQRVEILDAHFLRLLANLKKFPSAIVQAARLIENCKGWLSIEALSREIGLSERQLQRRFKDVIGLTPKQLCRNFRFKNLIDIINKNSACWAEAASYCGYYDQSHLISEFKYFTDKSPERYIESECDKSDFFYIELLKKLS